MTLEINKEKWEEKTLGEICEKISAGGDKPDIFSDIKTDTCCIPIYSNGIKDNGLYGYTDKATIDKPTNFLIYFIIFSKF